VALLGLRVGSTHERSSFCRYPFCMVTVLDKIVQVYRGTVHGREDILSEI
jgi:hypothetical protein